MDATAGGSNAQAEARQLETEATSNVPVHATAGGSNVRAEARRLETEATNTLPKPLKRRERQKCLDESKSA